MFHHLQVKQGPLPPPRSRVDFFKIMATKLLPDTANETSPKLILLTLPWDSTVAPVQCMNIQYYIIRKMYSPTREVLIQMNMQRNLQTANVKALSLSVYECLL